MLRKTGLMLLVALMVSGLAISCSKSGKLVILHMNDTHSEFYPLEGASEPVGGVARRATFIKQIRESNDNVMLIDAGGMMTGTAYCSYFKGEMSVELMNMMKYDLMAVGNHEFDFGLDNIVDLQETADFPFLSANVLDVETGEPVFTPYVIKKIFGAQVVFIGITTSEWEIMNQYLKNEISIRDEEETLKELFNDYRLAETNDIIICISHSGYDEDVAIAEKFSEIDVILSGNGDFLTLYPYEINGTLVLQAGDLGEYVGKLELEIENKEIKSANYELIQLASQFENDSKISDFLDERNVLIEDWESTPVCVSEVEMLDNDLRRKSVALGNLVADIMKKSAGADIAMINSGSIRKSIMVGDVNLGNVFELYPYDNKLVTCRMTGADILEIVKKSVSQRNDGGFLHFSEGFEVTVGASGAYSVLLNGVSLDSDKEYSIALSDFIYLGGDGYEGFCISDEVVESGLNIRDLIIGYFEELGTLTAENMPLEERILF